MYGIHGSWRDFGTRVASLEIINIEGMGMDIGKAAKGK